MRPRRSQPWWELSIQRATSSCSSAAAATSGSWRRRWRRECAVGGRAFAPRQASRQVHGIKAKTDTIDARLLRGFGRDRLNAGKLRLACRGRGARRTDGTSSPAQSCAACRAVPARDRRHRAGARFDRAHDRSDRGRALCYRVGALHPRSPRSAARVQGAGDVRAQRRGTGTARALLAELPEIGRLDRREIAALGSLAPRVHKSGRTHRRRGLAPGRSCVKVILFNPAAPRCDGIPRSEHSAIVCALAQTRQGDLGCGDAQTPGPAQRCRPRCSQPRGGAKFGRACGS